MGEALISGGLNSHHVAKYPDNLLIFGILAENRSTYLKAGNADLSLPFVKAF